MVIRTLDNILNFVPRGTAKAISHKGDGKGVEGLLYVPIAIVDYFACCGLQGAGAAYAAHSAGAGLTTTILAGVATAVAPPVVWMARAYWDLLPK
ncbi:MAG: hypothetical protein WCK90_03720 [archaeon]